MPFVKLETKSKNVYYHYSKLHNRYENLKLIFVAVENNSFGNVD